MATGEPLGSPDGAVTLARLLAEHFDEATTGADGIAGAEGISPHLCGYWNNWDMAHENSCITKKDRLRP